MKHSPKRQLWMIMIIVFLGFIGLSMPYLIFPVIFLNPEYSVVPVEWTTADRGILLGITLAAYPIGQFIGSPILGALSDDYGRRKVMTISLFIAGFFNLFTALSLQWNILPLLVFSRFCAGLMEGNLAIARAMAADIKELNKHTTFGKVGAAASLAYVVGPLIGGILSDSSINSSFTLSTPFYLVTVLFLGLSVLSHYCLEGRLQPDLTHHRTIWERLNLFNRVINLFKNPNLKFYLVITSTFTIAVDIFYEFGPVYLTMIWNATPSELALYNAVLAVTISIGGAYFTGMLAKRYSSRWIVSTLITCFALTLATITFTESFVWMYFLFGLIGLAIGVSTTTLTVKISDSASDQIQGEVMGVQTSLRVFGDAIICLAGGFFLIMSPKIVLIIAVIISLGAAIAYGLRRKNS
jgi:MFS family permease